MASQTRLKVTLGAANVKIVALVEGEPSKAADGDGLWTKEVENGEVDAAIHAASITDQMFALAEEKPECAARPQSQVA